MSIVLELDERERPGARRWVLASDFATFGSSVNVRILTQHRYLRYESWGTNHT